MHLANQPVWQHVLLTWVMSLSSVGSPFRLLCPFTDDVWLLLLIASCVCCGDSQGWLLQCRRPYDNLGSISSCACQLNFVCNLGSTAPYAASHAQRMHA